VAIVTGGASQAGRDVARGLVSWGWPIVVVYLQDQSRAEATVGEIVAAGGTTVAVRADLTDEVDVGRLFTESIAAFGGVDVVVHTTTDSAALLAQHAARYVRPGGAIVSTCAAERILPGVARQFGERGMTVGRAPPEAVLSFLDEWRRRTSG
jgi:3-oxoacyl-[acyl-carrier protein] reductase